jgi:hypothetical protein
MMNVELEQLLMKKFSLKKPLLRLSSVSRIFSEREAIVEFKPNKSSIQTCFDKGLPT